MQERKDQLNHFRLNPAPPKLPPQEYIDQYLETKDEKFLSWFLHWQEPAINQRIRSAMQRIKPKAFIDIAYNHGFASPSSAERIYRKVLEKMRRFIQEKAL